MNTIVAPKTDVAKLLGKQRLRDTAYRLMQFTLRARCEDGILLHNNITGHLVLLDAQETAALNALPMKPTQVIKSLIEDFFIVPVEYDEKAMVDNLRLLMKKIFTPKGINSYTIMTTTNCNARCFYCYQADYPHFNMTEETADHLLKYMVKNRGNDPLRIQWFGGEPLVGLARINQISNRLSREGIEFTSSMISNGFLFTDELVKRAVRAWKLKNIQITLDGTEDVYNRTKAYVSVESSPFKRVLQNIRLLLDHGVHVGLRLNLDQHNQDDLVSLITEMPRLFPSKEYLNVYAHVIYEDEGYAPIERGSKEREKLYRKQTQINKMIIDAGLCKIRYSLPSLKYRSCMADNPRSLVVYPDGRLFKCEHTVQGDEIGHIDSLIYDESKILKYTVPSNLEICNECPLYPSCYILQECDGIKDRKKVICGFDVTQKTMGLVQQYHNYMEKTESLDYEMKLKEGLDLTNC